ncbi:MAG: hypothetical protein ACP5JV_08605 [Thermus sp.]|uniref:hypothetical protein n=1 Tax=Thermus sp. TaxID=275 RepID=UPI003D112DF5
MGRNRRRQEIEAQKRARAEAWELARTKDDPELYRTLLQTEREPWNAPWGEPTPTLLKVALELRYGELLYEAILKLPPEDLAVIEGWFSELSLYELQLAEAALSRADLSPTIRAAAENLARRAGEELRKVARGFTPPPLLEFPMPFRPTNTFAAYPHTPERAQALLMLSRHAKRNDLRGRSRGVLYDLKASVLAAWVESGHATPIGYLRRAEPNAYDERQKGVENALDVLNEELLQHFQYLDDEPQSAYLEAAAWAWSLLDKELFLPSDLRLALLRLLDQWTPRTLGPISWIGRPEDFAELPTRPFSPWEWEEVASLPHLFARFHPYYGDLAVYRVDGLEVELHGPRTQAPDPEGLAPLEGEAKSFGRPPTPEEEEAWPLDRVVKLLTPDAQAVLSEIWVAEPWERSYWEDEDWEDDEDEREEDEEWDEEDEDRWWF